jgi:hypothetical protein
MNNFLLLFEYSINIPIFILLNKLPILAKISTKKSKLRRNLVLGLICTQKEQITKLDFLVKFLVNILEKLPESRQL